MFILWWREHTQKMESEKLFQCCFCRLPFWCQKKHSEWPSNYLLGRLSLARSSIFSFNQGADYSMSNWKQALKAIFLMLSSRLSSIFSNSLKIMVYIYSMHIYMYMYIHTWKLTWQWKITIFQNDSCQALHQKNPGDSLIEHFGTIWHFLSKK